MEERELWQEELDKELSLVSSHYTPDRYPQTAQTQREYEQTLNLLEEKYATRYDDICQGMRIQFDRDYRGGLLDRHNEQERDALSRTRNRDTELATRAGQLGSRQDIEEGKYRQTEDYKVKMQLLVEHQADERESTSELFRSAEQSLNERFGFKSQEQQIANFLDRIASMQREREDERER